MPAAKEMEQLVADRIEKTLLEAPHIDSIKSFSRPGETQLFVTAQDNTPDRDMPDIFYQVRKRVGDIQRSLPQGVQGPFFNDDFGETYGNVFALTGDGFSMAQLRDTADDLRKELLRVPGVAKVDVIGVQDEKIYVDLSNQKLANLGFSRRTSSPPAAWNAMNAAGSFETATDRIYLRPSGRFQSVEQIARPAHQRRQAHRAAQGHRRDQTRLRRSGTSREMRYEGTPAIGIGVSMQTGGDIIALGKHLDADIGRIRTQLPAGLVLHRVNDQPRAVRASISVFQRSVAEAVIIVLAVSFFSLGLRAGTVVALSIPLVLAATFFFMNIFDVGLHKISLGALIVALGLLVDDAIIAVEMMSVKMEQGFDRIQAASATYATTAFPMLTGTLITAAGFLPIATAQSTVGEYTRSLFEVVTIALLLSWLAAVVVIPYLGYKLLPDPHQGAARSGRFAGLRRRMQAVSARQHALGEMFYHRFRDVVTWCVTRRKTVILITLLVFIGCGVQLQIRAEAVLPRRHPAGTAGRSETARRQLPDRHPARGRQAGTLAQPAQNAGWSIMWLMSAAARRVSTCRWTSSCPHANFAQFVITTQDIETREHLRSQLIALMDSAEFAAVRGRVLRLENGPPVGFPVQFRISGENFDTLRGIAGQMAASDARQPQSAQCADWTGTSAPRRSVLDVDPARAQALGVTQQALSQACCRQPSRAAGVTTYRERDQLIEVVLRGAPLEREHLSLLANLNVPTASGKHRAAVADSPRCATGWRTA